MRLSLLERLPASSSSARPGLVAECPHVGASQRARRLARGMALVESLCVLAAMWLAGFFAIKAPSPPVDLTLAILGAAVLPGVFHLFGLHRVLRLSPAAQVLRVVAGLGLSFVVIAAAAVWVEASWALSGLGPAWILTTIFVVGSRLFWHEAIEWMRERGTLCIRTLIVGSSTEARRLAKPLGPSPNGFRVLGRISSGNGHPSVNGLRTVGGMSRLREIIRETQAECLFVAASGATSEDMAAVSKASRREGIEVRIWTDLIGVAPGRVSIESVAGHAVLALRPGRLAGRQAMGKRAFDLMAGGALFLISLPLWGVIAVAIKLTSEGPVVHRQTRVGREGRRFCMWKFRTMVEGADSMVGGLRSHNEAWGAHFKIRDDPRVTRLGRWLRRWSLDELPQLLNVLKGEMSLVGPRPPLPSEVATYDESQRERLEVTPGITGLWQVSGRSDLPFDECVRMDRFYIENWSLSLDLSILLRTIPAVLSRRGAY